MSLAFFTGLALLRAFAAMDAGAEIWKGRTVDTLLGILFGVGLSGAMPEKWADFLLGPRRESERPGLS